MSARTRSAPKRLFRVHRRGPAAFVGREPLPAVEAFIAAHRARFRPGELTEFVIEHDPGCRYPAGRPCTCVEGPEIRLKGERPEAN